MDEKAMTDPLCRWCTRPKSEHSFRRGTLLSSLICAGFTELPPPAAGVAIFGKPMSPSTVHKDLHQLTVGPFDCILMPAIEENAGRWWWTIEAKLCNAITGGYVDSPTEAASAIEKALTDIETAIRQARTA